MRLWTLHPSMLDVKGLTALWREGLGAQKSLHTYIEGVPAGYQKHPQLERFKAHPEPMSALVYYLREIHQESVRRGYKYDYSRIMDAPPLTAKIPVTIGQVDYESEWLESKLLIRSPKDLVRLDKVSLHPLFYEVEGDIESWEKNVTIAPNPNVLEFF